MCKKLLELKRLRLYFQNFETPAPAAHTPIYCRRLWLHYAFGQLRLQICCNFSRRPSLCDHHRAHVHPSRSLSRPPGLRRRTYGLFRRPSHRLGLVVTVDFLLVVVVVFFVIDVGLQAVVVFLQDTSFLGRHSLKVVILSFSSVFWSFPPC